LQRADLMILGGLNEGNWPALPSADPWLSPGIRRALGLPSPDFRIGLSAHDFSMALGARKVLLTRARKSGRAPTIASRFWRRLEAMTGNLRPDRALADWANGLDRRLPVVRRAARPKPNPPLAARPTAFAVTTADKLAADPYAFYAQQMLKLRQLEGLDAPAEHRWRGTIIHTAFERWVADDDARPDRLAVRMDEALAHDAIDPVMRALWRPRMIAAAATLARILTDARATGREPIETELKGEAIIAGININGTADRIDRMSDGEGEAPLRHAIVDYKSGTIPAKNKVKGGRAMQLGLLAEILAQGGFPEIPATTGGPLEYWGLSRVKGKTGDTFGCVVDIASHYDKPDELAAHADHVAQFTALVEKYLTAQNPFTAKANGLNGSYADYDHLMRLHEWQGQGDD
jgi:ATP-dependent helicase/nuclease subunit B